MPKYTHLKLSDVSSLMACREYATNNQSVTYNIDEVTCPKCKKRIELIWISGLYLKRLKKEIVQLQELAEYMEESIIGES